MDSIVSEFVTERVNAHVIYFRSLPDTSNPLELSRLTKYGSLYLLPNVDFNTGHNAYSWAVGALHSIYSRTRSERTKVLEVNLPKTVSTAVSYNGSFYLDGQGSKMIVALYSLADTGVAFSSWTITPPNGATINLGVTLGDVISKNYNPIYLATAATTIRKV